MLSEQVRDNPTTLHKFVEIFLTSAPADIDELRDALYVQDLLKSKAVAHRMKSSFLLMGAGWAAELCAQVEKAALAEEETKKLPEIFRELEQKYLAMEAALKELTF